jgi:hypothetical protein
MQSKLTFLALLLPVACSHPARQPAPARQANCDAGVISDTDVAGLPVRATVASAKAHCHVLADTTFAGLEGLPERTLDVQIGTDTVVAEIDSDRVVRIEVRSPRLRTRDSLGVGSSLATLLRHGHAKALIGEGSYYVVLQTHCGLSFGLPYFESPNAGDLDEAALRKLPDTIRVQTVLVVDCDSSQGAT